jgi:hypothetical protein
VDRGGIEPPTLVLLRVLPRARRAFVPLNYRPTFVPRPASLLILFRLKGIITTYGRVRLNGPVAQIPSGREAWLEHPTDNREAKGSNPFRPMNK